MEKPGNCTESREVTQQIQNPNDHCSCVFVTSKEGALSGNPGRGRGSSSFLFLGLGGPLIWEEFPTASDWVGAWTASHKYTNEQHTLAMTLPIGNSFGAPT